MITPWMRMNILRKLLFSSIELQKIVLKPIKRRRNILKRLIFKRISPL
jgi:hypothetical protein